ncbi:MAG TPA: hypothetical protein VF032_10245 [Thermoleophilaceae bacterium]
MVQIRRIKFFKPRYAVTDSDGALTSWAGRFGREGASAYFDGQAYAFRRDGRKRFVLSADDAQVALAERAHGQWRVSSDGSDYALVRPSKWRSGYELRAEGRALGTISRRRRTVSCDLPDELSVTLQAFIGFVAIALWNREAAAAGGAGAASA